MALFSWLDPVDEENALKDAKNNIEQENKLKSTSLPDTSSKVGQIYKQAPWIPPSVVLALAKGNASPQAIEAASRLGMKQYVNETNPAKPKGNWFQRNVYDKAKAVSRWTFAGLQLAPDLAQNVASQVFSGNDPNGIDGWFASTQLGTMMSEHGNAGSGFFFSGQANETQAQRAREFRGTVGNSAWTIGRGAADIFFTPGSREFSILSGFVDAATTIFSDPTTYIGPAVKAAKTGEAAKGLFGTKAASQKLADVIAEKGLVEIDRIPGLGDDALKAAQTLARGEAGLDSAEGIVFSGTKFGQWVQSNTKAQRLLTRNADRAATITRQVAEGAITAEQAQVKRGFLAYQLIEEFKGRIDETTAMLFAEADDVTKQMGVLGEISARLAQSTENVVGPRLISDVTGAGKFYDFRQGARERLPLYRSLRNSRWFTTMPKNAVALNGSGLDRAQAITNYGNYFKTMDLHNTSPELFEQYMGRVVMGFGISDPVAQKEAVENLFNDAVIIAFENADKGNGRRIAEAVITKANEVGKSRVFNASDVGALDDAGLVQLLKPYFPKELLARYNADELRRLALQGPGSLVEMQESVYILPDVRKIRALTANPFVRRAVVNKDFEQRAPQAIVEFVQNDIWKPLALATGGYVMRNMIDAQTRIALAGLKGFFNHPFQFIQQAMGDSAIGGITEDVMGNPVKFDGSIKELLNTRDARLEDFQDALTFGAHVGLDDPTKSLETLVRNGSFSLIDRGQDAANHTIGMVDNLALISDDKILRRMVQLRNMTPEERGKDMLNWFKTDPIGQEQAGKVIKYFRSGVRVADPQTGRYSIIQFTDAPEDELLELWVTKLSENKINTIIRGDEDLAFVVQNNRVPRMVDATDPLGVKVGTQRAPLLSVPEQSVAVKGGEPMQVGSFVDLGPDEEGIIVALRDPSPTDLDPFTGKPFTGKVAEIQPVEAGEAFTGDFIGSEQFRALIDEKGNAGMLPQVVKLAQRGIPKEPAARNKALDAWRRGADFFFNGLYGRAVQKMERSIVWRQYFYNEIGDNLDLLAPSEAQKLVDNVVEFARRYETTPEKYIGDKDIWRRIQQTARETTSQAEGTLEQLEDFASKVAVYRTKELLYNAVERSNLEDVLRVVVPFASAWKEVLGTYADFLIEDPTRIRRAQLAFTGATNFDPDNDGEGFFYKDPTTGEYSFNFPGSGWIAEHLTGVNAPLQAPVKRLSIGLGIIPSIGPVAQVAASRIIPDTPAFDEIVNILMPYGRKEGFPIAPTWLTRAKDIIEADSKNTQTIYANTYIETLRALTVSGEYNLQDPNDKEKLYADARNKARVLASMRVLGQFIGPTSPSAEFKVATEQGDIYATKLVQEFYKLQAENYDTAVQRFLETYGNDAILYVSSKSEALMGGLEATDEFGDWERTNSGLFNKYPDVAGYMAPGGTDFDFQVWNRQLTSGKRRRLTDRELVAEAEYRVGMARYKELQAKLGPQPSSEQKEWLSQWRKRLYEEYPGFLTNSKYDPNAFIRKVAQMKQMVAEPRLQNNEAAQALSQYLAYRDKAIAQAEASGYKSLNSKAAEPLRDWLSSIAVGLSQEVPEFARIYDRELSYEVNQ
jgi:hypothetical protein